MAKIDPTKLWSLHYQLMMSIISAVSPEVATLGLEIKELFVLAKVDTHPYPAELATVLCMPKPSVTVYVKRLEAAGFVRREIDTQDLRRHRLQLTAAGRKAMQQGMALLTQAFGEKLGRLSASQQAELAALMEKMA
jgi:DNA-binding MarR family transcriptional regulator